MRDRGKLGRSLQVGGVAALLTLAFHAGRRQREGHALPDELGDDITSPERTQLLERASLTHEAVARANAEMETLIYTVSHDLKSPLITVLGYIDLLRAEGIELPEDAANYIDRIEAGAQYMQELINDLLLLSRIGRQEMNAADIDLAPVVAEVIDELRPRAPKASIAVGPLPVVTMSPVRARQLLGNLVDNALIHSRREDVIVEVGAEPMPDGGARVWVADDGHGIPNGERERAFGIFERLGERPAGEGGTGVGLSVCRKIVEQLGGTVTLADVPVGVTAEIVFPPTVVAWTTTDAGAMR